MRIISRARLREFWQGHKQDKAPLGKWYKTVKFAIWEKPNNIKETYNSVDPYTDRKLRKTVYIFNVGGNNVRVICAIHFNTKRVYIRFVLTHEEYSQEKWKERL